MYHTPSSRSVKYVLKIFQTKIMKNEIFKNCSWKRAFRFMKRATLFDKRALGSAEGAGRGRIPLIRSCF